MLLLKRNQKKNYLRLSFTNFRIHFINGNIRILHPGNESENIRVELVNMANIAALSSIDKPYYKTIKRDMDIVQKLLFKMKRYRNQKRKKQNLLAYRYLKDSFVKIRKK